MPEIYSYPFSISAQTTIAVSRRAARHQVAIKSGSMTISLVPPGGAPIPVAEVVTPTTAYEFSGRYDLMILTPTGTVVGEIVSSVT